MIEKAITLLRSRGFCAISIIVDPFGIDETAYLSTTHKEFSAELRFLVVSDNLTSLEQHINEIVTIYDEKRGKAWKISNARKISLGSLPTNKLLIQGTEAGITIAQKLLGVTITDASEIREIKKPS